MEYILGIVILVIALIIWGYFLKRKHFKEIDQLEAWKMDIMNRPILEELSKVKQLNMTGETEEMFERWRKEWDAIITVYLPDVEELFFDAEDYVDKYRLGKSKEVQRMISTKLTDIVKTIEKILMELNDLVGSEEKNRVEIEEIKESYRKIKKDLLAHRHTFAKAADPLDDMLDEIVEILKQYEEATENGNYLNARELVLSIKNKLATIQTRMDIIPQLLLDGHSSLPTSISELKDGFKEMVEQGYSLEHIEFETEILRLEAELEHYNVQLNLAEAEVAEKGINEIFDHVNLLYDLLEKEVLSKQYLIKNENLLKENLEAFEYENDKLKAETAVVRHSYHVTESELSAQKKLEKQIDKLIKRFQLLTLKIADNATISSVLSDEMKEIEAILNELKVEHEVFSEKLHALRKDELQAREVLQELRKKMGDTSRTISQSNVPGLPERYRDLLSEAKESIEDVQSKLEENPLDMGSVHIFLEKAIASVTRLYENTEVLIEEMLLAEKVIQYGNRYRSRYPAVAEALRTAEQYFRDYEYERALEVAVSAIEKVEPGILDKIEANMEEVHS
ncbi:septation ring formation regulator EzrA [Peribacillus loiseleuriae]|uniref:septation ring formation regulator EzrA n=1 Tax=Peribacillus loiseleuriae TaxID=1679170 RepID=UPI003D08E80C